MCAVFDNANVADVRPPYSRHTHTHTPRTSLLPGTVTTTYRETIAQVPLEICGGGSEAAPAEMEWKWTGAALPVVWCPSSSPSRQRRRRRLGQQDAELAVDRGASSAAGSFATASLARNTWGRSGIRSDDAGRVTVFDIREDGGRRGGRGMTQEGSIAPAIAAATAAEEVRGERGREERYLAGAGRLRSSPRSGALSGERGGARGVGRRRLDGSDGGGSGEDGDSALRRGGDEGAGEELKENGGEEGEMKEEHQKEEGEKEEEGKIGGSNRVGDAVRLAWIPADPCSCTDAPGAVGEACRGWLMARAAGDGEAQAPSEVCKSCDKYACVRVVAERIR